MFFKTLIQLCNKNNTTPNAVCLALGLSPAAATKWRSGAVPRETTLLKIANHFNVTVDYLLGKTDDPSPSNKESDSPERDPELIELENGLTPEELVELKRYAAYLLSQRNKK